MKRYLIVMAAVLLGCSFIFPGFALAAKDVLVVASPADIRMLDPAVTFDNLDWRVTYYCYDRLVRYKVRGEVGLTVVEPMVATSWEVSQDQKTWVFQLRKGIKFDDGTPLDAEAVKFTFERLIKIGKGPSTYFSEIESVEVVNDYTVRFNLKYPFAPFLSTLATNAASIINPSVIKYQKDGDLAQGWLAEHIDGSGPFQLVEWEKDQRVVLEVKLNYWGEKPKVKKVIIRVIPESTNQRMALEIGDVDIAAGILIDQIPPLEENPQVIVRKYPSMFVDYVYINTQRSPLDNPKVRQALSYAVDYQSIIQYVLKGYGVQMRGPIPKGMWGHSEKITQYSRDVKKAQQLLGEAGYPNGFSINFMFSSYRPTWEQETLIIQSNLADIGVKVNLQQLANPVMRDKIDRGEFDLCMGVWSPDFADPYMFMNYWFDSSKFGLSGNRAFYKSEKVGELIRKAGVLTEREEREKLYLEAQRIIMEDAPYILLYQTQSIVPTRKEVRNFVYNPMLEKMYNFNSLYKE
jgi:peptide/nickel transport system substrate-binding protein